jgi:tetratricopeptide (TPR) repeat protein
MLRLSVAAALCLLTLLAVTLVGCGGVEIESPEQAIREGDQEYSYFNFDGAYAYHDAAVNMLEEGSEDWQHAIFARANAAYHINPPDQGYTDQARADWERLIKVAPDGPYAARTLLNLGRLAELRDYRGDNFGLQGEDFAGAGTSSPGRPMTEVAREYYQQVLDEFPDTAYASEAMLRIAGTYIQTYDQEQAKKGIELLAAWLEEHPRDPFASVMWQYIGDTWFNQFANPDDPDDYSHYAPALEAYLKADAPEIGGLSQVGREGPTFWQIAIMAHRLWLNTEDPEKKAMYRDVAVEYYTRMIKQVPKFGKGYRAWHRLKDEFGVEVPDYLEMVEQGKRERLEKGKSQSGRTVKAATEDNTQQSEVGDE